MMAYSWILKDSWVVESGSRFVFSNTPGNVHLIDVTLPCKIEDLRQNVTSKQWTVDELTEYLNQLNKNRGICV